MHEPTNDISLKGADFDLVNDLTDECEKITITAERLCGGTWATYWQGFFAKFNCRFDYGGIKVRQCLLEAKLTKEDKFDCLLKNWQSDVNIYSASVEISVKPFVGTYEVYAGAECNYCSGDSPPVICDTIDDTWCLESQVAVSQNYYNGTWPCGLGDFYITQMYHRITGTGTPTTPPPFDSGWVHLSGSTWWRCPGSLETSTQIVAPMTHGRRFNDILEFVIDELDCGLTVRSHFFGINATHAAAPSNIAYDYATAWFQDLTIHRKSDVKRPQATNPAAESVWIIKAKDLLDDFKKVFNVYWKINGDDLIIEHISYFEGTAGADYSDSPMPLQLKFEDDTPKKELFYWQDKNIPGFFKAQPIVYDCGSGEREFQSALFSTDVKSIQDEAYQEAVQDAGWVLISCVISGGQYYANSLDDHLNGAFRWENLHTNLHKHNRPFGSGLMNGAATDFLTVQKLKQQPEFAVGLCCDEAFDPTEYITTLLGQGQIQTAVENVLQDTIELNLNY